MRISRMSIILVVSAILLVCLSSRVDAQDASGSTTISAVELKKMQDVGKDKALVLYCLTTSESAANAEPVGLSSSGIRRCTALSKG